MQRHKRGSHSRPNLSSLEKPQPVEIWPKYAGPKLLSPKAVVVYGSRLCVCCTRLRRLLEQEGWRYRWVEMTKNGMLQLRLMMKAAGLAGDKWKGGLPVIKIDGLWLEVPSTPDGSLGWAPWPIRNPKKRQFIPLEF